MCQLLHGLRIRYRLIGNRSSVLAFDHSNTQTFAGVIAGSGAVTQIGAGTTILTGANTYSGGTTISAGTPQLGSGGASGSIIGTVTDNSELAFDYSNTQTFAGTISGSGGVTQIGAGTTIWTGSVSYAGGTTISAGALQLGNGSLSGNIVDNTALTLSPTGTLVPSDAISGSGTVTQRSAPARRSFREPTPIAAARRSARARCNWGPAARPARSSAT
jgi:autotransporter-associated beta strand protein